MLHYIGHPDLSGNSSKSGDMCTFPRHCPPTRGPRVCSYRTIRTTGLPARPITTSSPFSTQRTSLQRSVRACDMFEYRTSASFVTFEPVLVRHYLTMLHISSSRKWDESFAVFPGRGT